MSIDSWLTYRIYCVLLICVLVAVCAGCNFLSGDCAFFIDMEVKSKYNFVPYRKTDVYKRCINQQHSVNMSSSPTAAEYNILRDIVQAEQPINLDELCRRIAPI